MKTAILLLLFSILTSVSFAQTPAMREAVLASIVQSNHRQNLAAASARIVTGVNAERGYRDLDSMLTREYGDMFWMYSVAGFYFSTHDVLSDSLKLEIRNAWKLRTPYRGDTENHFLMYYGSLFLMSEVWPNLPGSEWFTGQSSDEIQKESREYLLHWMDEVSRYGLGEFDSPRYHYYFITPLILLSEYAQDKKIKQLAEMTVELLLADYAVKYMNGNYAGAHSRTFEAAALTGYLGETGGYGDYFFEDSVRNVQPDLAFVALTDYRCPEIIRNIAKQRKQNFVLQESKQPRKRIRFVGDTVVTKYTYFGDGFALGSLQSGIVQPIQQQSWKLVFDSKASPNTITGLHPYISERELALYFPEEPIFQKEKIESTKAGYSSEDKWIGGSPYQFIDQEENALLAVFDIPEDVSSRHGDLFIPKGAVPLDTLRSGEMLDANVWHIFRFDSTYIGLQLLKPMQWTDLANGVRLRGYDRGGYVIVADRAKDVAAFRASIMRHQIRSSGSSSTFTMRDLKLSVDTKRKRTKPLPWLYNSPYINSKKGSGVVTLTYNNKRRILNFVTGEVVQE